MNQLHHIAIICSSIDGLQFYKDLGFQEIERINRERDCVIFLKGYEIILEIFVDSSHPSRLSNPEALGLRHFAIRVDDFSNLKDKYKDAEIKTDWHNEKYFILYDLDGLPIEIHE